MQIKTTYSTEKPTTIPAVILSMRPKYHPNIFINPKMPITIPKIETVEIIEIIQFYVEIARTKKAKIPV